MRRFFTNPRHLLPLMIFIGVLIVGMRVSDVWDAVSTGKLFTAAAAQTKSDAPAPAASPPASVAEDPSAAGTKPVDSVNKSPDSTTPAAPPEDDSDVSPAEMEVLKQLSQRRVELDKRSRELDQREALIKVAETRVDQKIKEMESLRLQLQSMVNQVSEAQAAQLDNLVKIYETMKPKEAARVFETLDMPVLLSVIQRMKPTRTAPILAEMAPEKAKDVTTALTKQDQLPKVK